MQFTADCTFMTEQRLAFFSIGDMIIYDCPYLSVSPVHLLRGVCEYNPSVYEKYQIHLYFPDMLLFL